MAKAYVSEYHDIAVGARGLAQAPQSPPLATQVVDFTAGVTATANAFNAATRFVEIDVDAICSFAFALTPVATTSNQRVPAGSNRIYGVVPGHKVSFIVNT